MEVLNEKMSDQSKAKRFRLVVRSAEEAVRVIREKLGESARVLSVRQVGGEGLRKFISSPKLEVIAELPIEDESNVVGIESDKLSNEGNLEVANSKPEVLAKEKPKIDTKPIEQQTKEIVKKHNSDSNSIEILKKAGFDAQLLSVIETWSNWSDSL